MGEAGTGRRGILMLSYRQQAQGVVGLFAIDECAFWQKIRCIIYAVWYLPRPEIRWYDHGSRIIVLE